MHFLSDVIKGIAIGAGAILPGISSGVLCVVFGIYETLLNCALNFFKNIKYNFKILFPIALGAFIGIVLFGNILKYVFYAYPIQTKSIFIGLIIGSIPELFKNANSCKKDNINHISRTDSDSKSHINFNRKTIFNLQYLFFLVFSFVIGLLLVYLEEKYHFSNENNYFSFLYLLLSGLLMSAGVIIPGVSSTLILMLLGVYNAYLISISSLYIPFLFPLTIGLIVGSICCMKLIKFLLDNFHTQTFFSIIGFTIGSVFVLFPRISSLNEAILSILCITLGTFIVCFPLSEKA
ncbi:MAG: DUF368 domain-containing protein [Clostridia bacterium]|nr:DUF368 domain-containing protein [Clostridia bacterium]